MNLAPSGVVVYSPSGPNANFTMNLGVGDASIFVYTARFSGGSVEFQSVASGASVVADVVSSNTTVGTITTSPVLISSGAGFATTLFHAITTGTSTITASSAGYTGSSIAVTVQSPTIIAGGGITVGQFLEDSSQLILPVPAPAGGLQVTLQSNSPLLKLALNATDAPASSIVINMTASQSVANYYVIGLGSSGTPTFTATAPGYSPGNGSITLQPSGIVVIGPSSATMPGLRKRSRCTRLYWMLPITRRIRRHWQAARRSR